MVATAVKDNFSESRIVEYSSVSGPFRIHQVGPELNINLATEIWKLKIV